MHSIELLSPQNIRRISELARWGDGTVHDFTWSPDGNVLALATSIGIHFYDAHTFRLVREMSIGAPASHVAFSPDGTLLLTISRATQLWVLPFLGGDNSQLSEMRISHETLG